MVMVFEGTEKEFSMDGFLKTNLDTAKEVIRKDWDMIFCYDGYEGSGKTTIAAQNAMYCDSNLSLKNYAFSSKQFKEVINKAKKYRAVVYDEAYSGLSSRGAMSKINRSIVSMLTEIRYKNLFVFIVLPCFFDLDKYVALWRSRALIHVYTVERFVRGYFEFYNMDKKKDLYMKGKKLYEYKFVRPNFRGRFSKYFPLDAKKYNKMKRDAQRERTKLQESAEERAQFTETLFKHIQDTEVGLTHEQKRTIMGMPSSTYYMKLKDYKDNKQNP